MHLRNRPTSLDGIIGNSHIKKALSLRIRDKAFSPLLFIGHKGTGKTTLALIMAKEFGAHEQNIRHLNCVDVDGISEMRELVSEFDKPTIFGRKKVYIFDEIHELSPKAQQELLVPLEQEKYVGRVLFIACTTTLRSVKDTLVERFTDFKTYQLTKEDSRKLLDRTLEKEKVALDKYTIQLIINKSEGFPRIILKSISKVVGIEDKEEIDRLVEMSSIDEDEDILLLMKLIIGKKSWGEVKSYLLKLLKNKSVNNIRAGMMNLIAYRITSNFMVNEEEGDKLTYMFDRLRVADSFLERANLIIEVYSIYRIYKGE